MTRAKYTPSGDRECRETTPCLCPFCCCGTYDENSVAVSGIGIGGFTADLVFVGTNSTRTTCTWGGNTTVCSFPVPSPCSGFTSFYVEFIYTYTASFWYSPVNCTRTIKAWDSSAKNTLYLQLEHTGTCCVESFTGVTFSEVYNGLPCSAPTTVTMTSDVLSLNECDRISCCPITPCPCGSATCDTVCIDGEMPAQMQLDISGTLGTSGSGCEGDCPHLDGSYILDFFGKSGECCLYMGGTQDNVCLGLVTWGIKLCQGRLYVLLFTEVGAVTLFATNLSEPTDCTTISETLSNTRVVFTGECYWPITATADVTAL